MRAPVQGLLLTAAVTAPGWVLAQAEPCASCALAHELATGSRVGGLPFLVVTSLMVGALGVMGAYFASLYARNRGELIFGTYAAYLFLSAAYWASRNALIAELYLPGPVVREAAVTLSQIGFHLAYGVFAIQLIGTRRHYPRLHWLWVVTIGAVAAVGVWLGVLLFTESGGLPARVFFYERVGIGSISLLTSVYLLFRGVDLYARLYAVASTIFVGSAMLAMFVYDLDALAVGTVIEIVIFAYAIGHRINARRERRLGAERRAFQLEREVARTKDAALRAQMNPHFVSNVINALRSLVLDGANDAAYRYLTRFAHLVRTMLQSSENDLISLDEELRLLEDYVELEELRFTRSLTLVVDVDAGVRPGAVAVPPLLLQPLVENAIHHGLVALSDGRTPTVSVAVAPHEMGYEVVIEDNGVGRQAAGDTQRRRPRSRPSMALGIIRERLALFHAVATPLEGPPPPELLTFTDLTDGDTALGTRVRVLLPVRRYAAAGTPERLAIQPQGG